MFFPFQGDVQDKNLPLNLTIHSVRDNLFLGLLLAVAPEVATSVGVTSTVSILGGVAGLMALGRLSHGINLDNLNQVATTMPTKTSSAPLAVDYEIVKAAERKFPAGKAESFTDTTIVSGVSFAMAAREIVSSIHSSGWLHAINFEVVSYAAMGAVSAYAAYYFVKNGLQQIGWVAPTRNDRGTDGTPPDQPKND